VPVAPNRPNLAGATAFTVSPVLPLGLHLDWSTGEISGTPTNAVRPTSYVVRASLGSRTGEEVLRISVTPALPSEVESLAEGFSIELLRGGLFVPVKLAFAPDGRLFFTELSVGRVRVIDADGMLVTEPVATIAIVPGAERGLLGIALPPDFESTPELYVYATVPPGGGKPMRNQVIRLTLDGDTATDATVVIDDLPAGDVENAGDLAFGPDGLLYVSIGDTGDESLAQQDGALAGRILRYRRDGTVPDDNPIPGSPEWCRGLRNSFDMTFHPRTGGLFATENGPTFGDEVNYIRPGMNYGWGPLPEDFPGSRIGPRIAEWTPVIAPTGLAFPTGFGGEYEGSLFVLGYVESDLRRLVLSGGAYTDLDEELPFARWRDDGGVENKPLDVVSGPDGALYVSTFTSIWRIERY
jgi:glucose/arabinose dehydrogenase